MARKSGGGIGTTHVSRHSGHGQTIPRSRFAIRVNHCVRGMPRPNKTDSPWYRKEWGSRPEYKRRRLAEVA